MSKTSKLSMTVAAVVLASCTSVYEPEPKETNLQDGMLISRTASLGGVLVLERNGDRIICAQPAPDAAFSQGEAGNFSLNIFSSQSDTGAQAEDSAELEMAGRTPSILLARELFYRLCEFGQNYQLTKEEALDLYRSNLSLIESISGSEAENTTVTIGDTLSISESMKTQSIQPLNPPSAQASPPTQAGGQKNTDPRCDVNSAYYDPDFAVDPANNC